MSVVRSEEEAQSVALRTAPDGGSRRPVVPVLVVLCLLAGAFLLGRRASVPASAPAAAPAGNAASHAGGEDAAPPAEEGQGQKEGIIKFTPEALARADLRIQPVATTTVRSYLQVTGAVEPNIAGVVKVTPRVAGKITSLQASMGDTVLAGQVLATMTSTEIAQAQAQYRQATARVAAAQANLRRQRQLAGFGEFGQHKVQEARGSFNAAQGDVNEAQAEINAGRSEVAQAQAALAAAQSDEAGAQSDVAAAETEVTQAQTQVAVSQSRFNRQEALLKEQLTSRQDWEQAQADLKKSQSDVQATQARVRSATAKVAAAQAKVQQATSEIETNRARLQQSEAKLTAARERLSLAGTTRVREEKIFQSGVLTSKEVAEAEATLRQAEIDRTAAENAVGLLGGTPGGGNTLAVSAPLAGRITERPVTAGETVSPDKPLFTIVNLKTVWVQLSVYQRDMPSVRVGLPVIITTDAVPGKRFVGTVAYIGDVVDETTRTVKVRCVIPNPGNRLKPDMFVRGRIAAPAPSHGIAVPKDAVQTHDGKTVVFVQGDRPEEFQAKGVQVGDTVEGQTVIASGLRPGDRVVTRGAFIVKAQAMKGELTEE